MSASKMLQNTRIYLSTVMLLLIVILGNTSGTTHASGRLFALTWSPDGTYIAGTGDGFLRLWDATSGEIFLDFPSMIDVYVLNASWEPNGEYIATASDDNLLRIWNINNANYAPGELIASIQTVTAENAQLTNVAWHPDGHTIATSSVLEHYTLRIWDVTTYQLDQEFLAGWIQRLAWNADPDTYAIATADDNAGPTIQFVNHSPENTPIIGDYNVPASAMAWDSTGANIAVGYFDGSIRIWDATTNDSILVLQQPTDERIRALNWNWNDTQMISADNDGTIRIWDVSNGLLLLEIQSNIGAAAFSPIDNHFVYGTVEGDIVIQSVD